MKEQQPFPKLPEPIGDHNPELSKWISEQYFRGWQFIEFNRILEEHKKGLEIMKEKRLKDVDFSDFDYSPGDGFF